MCTFSVQIIDLAGSGRLPQCSALIKVDRTFIVAGNPFDIVSKCELSSNQIREHAHLFESVLCYQIVLTGKVCIHTECLCAFGTLRSGQLNSSNTCWKSSIAPSVINMIAWLHKLPLPSAAAYTHKQTVDTSVFPHGYTLLPSYTNTHFTSLRILKDSFMAFFTFPSPFTCNSSTKSLKCWK